MSVKSILFNLNAAKADRKRDSAIPLPEGVSECRNISYGAEGKSHLLDVYVPHGTKEPLPTIVSIHGGGYVYGNKEIYRRYGMDMARRGFAFVNFNYRLAPRWKFPAPLYDTNAVMQWICKNAHRYHLDPKRIILVGDSAGAQLASQYAAIWASQSYADLFPITVPLY
jgi:acetyl esterase/lipase